MPKLRGRSGLVPPKRILCHAALRWLVADMDAIRVFLRAACSARNLFVVCPEPCKSHQRAAAWMFAPISVSRSTQRREVPMGRLRVTRWRMRIPDSVGKPRHGLAWVWATRLDTLRICALTLTGTGRLRVSVWMVALLRSPVEDWLVLINRRHAGCEPPRSQPTDRSLQ